MYLWLTRGLSMVNIRCEFTTLERKLRNFTKGLRCRVILSH